MTSLESFRPIIDSRLLRVRRIFHVLGDEVKRSEGAVELRFSSGHTIHGDAGPDGDSMKIFHEEWVDPFEGNLTPENQEFIATSGKATAFDVSDEPPFASLIGGRVMEICEIAGVSGKRIGYVFDIAGELLVMYVNSDETFVTLLP